MPTSARTASPAAAINAADPRGQLASASRRPNPCPRLVEIHPRCGLGTAVDIASSSSRRHGSANIRLVHADGALHACYRGLIQLGSLSSGCVIGIRYVGHTNVIEQLC